MSKTILVTGANGFLGSAITKLALKKGCKVNALIRRNSDTKNIEHLKDRINFFYGDLRDFHSLHLPLEKSDLIFHVAADYRLWARKKTEIYASNVLGTENVAM
jgi:dihydroflavonol-4-reductase